MCVAAMATPKRAARSPGEMLLAAPAPKTLLQQRPGLTPLSFQDQTRSGVFMVLWAVDRTLRISDLWE